MWDLKPFSSVWGEASTSISPGPERPFCFPSERTLILKSSALFWRREGGRKRGREEGGAASHFHPIKISEPKQNKTRPGNIPKTEKEGKQQAKTRSWFFIPATLLLFLGLGNKSGMDAKQFFIKQDLTSLDPQNMKLSTIETTHSEILCKYKLSTGPVDTVQSCQINMISLVGEEKDRGGGGWGLAQQEKSLTNPQPPFSAPPPLLSHTPSNVSTFSCDHQKGSRYRLGESETYNFHFSKNIWPLAKGRVFEYL